MYSNILQVIGNTPLVRLAEHQNIYLKLEYLNPGGSIKDRPALFMIEEAEKSGQLKPGDTIIDASSGNFGATLAMIGAIKGYKVVITVPEKISAEKLGAIKAYGAEVIVCPVVHDVSNPQHYRRKVEEVQKSLPNSFRPNQYYNENNPLCHFSVLGPEIWRQTEGKITHLFVGIGTGGTISGVGKYLKAQNQAIKIIGVDSDTSSRATNGNPGSSKVEGIGIDPDMILIDYTVIDTIINISDSDAFNTVKTIATQNGILLGPSSGAVIAAVLQYQFTPDDLVVVICPDSGKAYLSKM